MRSKVLYSLLLSFGLLVFLTSCTPKKASAGKGQSDIDVLVNLMTGSFNSGAQAASDSDYYDISLHMYPIWEDRKGEHWLYVEQAVTAAPERPYRQRVYKVEENKDGSFISLNGK